LPPGYPAPAVLGRVGVRGGVEPSPGNGAGNVRGGGGQSGMGGGVNMDISMSMMGPPEGFGYEDGLVGGLDDEEDDEDGREANGEVSHPFTLTRHRIYSSPLLS
jgi:hypothetical protein